MTYDASGGYPTLAEVRAWIQVPATVLADAELEQIAGAEQRAQSFLDWGSTPDVPVDIPDDVYQAFLRRVARHVAAKGIPLGILAADAEWGTVRLARWDNEVVRLEAPYVMQVIA